jgi:hypothetical protein
MVDAIAAVPAQRRRALEYANGVRRARADLKRRVRAGRLGAAEVVVACPWYARTMTVTDLLVSQRGWGPIRSRRLLRSVLVPENKQVGALTQRQRLAIVAVLAQRDSAQVAR